MVWPFGDRTTRIERAAAKWRAEMQEPASDRQVARFERWLRSDPAHHRAYRAVDDIAALGERSIQRPARVALPVARSRGPAFALAAAIVLAIAIWSLIPTPWPVYAAIANPTAAIRTVRLQGGATLTLDAGASIEVAQGATAPLLRSLIGRARLSLPATPVRPLRLTTDQGIVSGSNCMFDLITGSRRLVVSVIRGSLVVAPAAAPDAPIALDAGQSLSVSDGQAAAVADGTPDPSWPDARVGFDGASLASVLAAANRAGRPRLVPADATIASLKVTGVLDLRDTRRLARKLAAALGLRVREADGTITLAK